MYQQWLETAFGILVPFFGTVLGAASVFFFSGALNQSLQASFFGFAAGVMQAAAIWSLILPAIDFSGGATLPVLGLLCGMGVFLLADVLLFQNSKRASFTHSSKILALSVTLHNIPEGMAVGVAFASALGSSDPSSLTPALILSLGVAIQNFPEGAVISMPLAGVGVKRKKAFALGALSGIVEPIGALLALILTRFIVPLLPFLLTFAAGAMMYVIIVELIPDLAKEKKSISGYTSYAIGFSLMMFLDVVLG